MRTYIPKCFLVIAAVALAGCETESKVVKLSFNSPSVRQATIFGAALPVGCPRITKTFPAGKSTFEVRYREPETDQKGRYPHLAYTTIYMRNPNGQTRAIRIPADTDGGAIVSVFDIPVAGSEIELCVTATNRDGMEGEPGP